VLAANAEVRAAFERVRAADAARVQARAWNNPEASLDAEGIGGDRDGFDEAEVTVSLGVPLELFGTRGLRAGAAEARVSRERARYHGVRRDLTARTWAAFHRALAARERVRIARSRVDVTRETAAATAAQVEAGKASPLERVRAEVEGETARAALESALSDYHTAREELSALWARSGADSLVPRGALRARTPDLDRDRLAAEVLEGHPTLVAARWDAEGRRRDARLSARERWPDVVPSAGIRFLRGSDEHDFVAGVGIEIPLFDRGGAKHRAASRRAEAAAHDETAVRVSLLAELHTLLEELAARARALAVYEDDIAPRAAEALELARTGYERGKFGYIDLLDAQRTVIEVEDGRAAALIAYDRALVRLESLLGRRIDDNEPTREDHP